MTLAARALLPPLFLLTLALGACGGGQPSEPQPLSGEMESLLHEVAAMRQLEAPTDLRLGTVTPRDLPDVWPGEPNSWEEITQGRHTRLYQLLGFLREGQHIGDARSSLSSSVAGFYSYERILWIVTEDGGVNPGEFSPRERETVVHEMIHALQDHHFDLASRWGTLGWILDRRAGFGAVLEGDATVHASRLTGRVEPPTARGAYEFLAAPNHMTNVPAPIAREFWFSYTAGSAWAQEVLATQGPEALNHYIRNPPSTTIILHPELIESGWKPERVSTQGLPGLRANLVLLGLQAEVWGSLGEFVLLNYLLGDAPAPSDWRQDPWTLTALDAAAGWAGDYYYLYGHADDWVIVARVRFVSEEDAHDFAEAQRVVATKGAKVVEDGGLTLATQENGNVTALLGPVGRDVIFAIGTSEKVARAAVEPLLEG